MKKTRKIAGILTMATAFCFVMFYLVQADQNEQVTKGTDNESFVFVQGIKDTKSPIWQITEEGTSEAVKWVDHKPNPRFAIYDPGTPEDNLDDLVLDKETGLVWARNANLNGVRISWGGALNYCRWSVKLGNRMGWRLPTVEELSSLVDTSQSAPALPSGHPFENVQQYNYWSSTTYEWGSSMVWTVHINGAALGITIKTDLYSMWPVRGGNAYASGNW